MPRKGRLRTVVHCAIAKIRVQHYQLANAVDDDPVVLLLLE